MACPRCGGFWVELGEDSHCINCGNATMPGHPQCSTGEELTHWEKKQARKYKRERPPPMKMPNKVKYSKPGRPSNQVKTSETLQAEPKTVPIREHPYVLWLAKQWEDLEAEKNCLENKQNELKESARIFEEAYPQNMDVSSHIK